MYYLVRWLGLLYTKFRARIHPNVPRVADPVVARAAVRALDKARDGDWPGHVHLRRAQRGGARLRRGLPASERRARPRAPASVSITSSDM